MTDDIPLAERKFAIFLEGATISRDNFRSRLSPSPVEAGHPHRSLSASIIAAPPFLGGWTTVRCNCGGGAAVQVLAGGTEAQGR